MFSSNPTKKTRRVAGIVATLAVVGGSFAALAAPSVAYATEDGNTATPVLDRRQENQADRIRQGVRSGELTRPETRRLVHGQAHLRRMEHRAEADGDVTARERARLHREANQQSRRIYRQKHDRQDRG